MPENEIKETLQLCALRAEALAEQKFYRELKDVAREVLELMRAEEASAATYAETIPRIAAALGETVFYRDLYEILLRYIAAVVRQGDTETDLRDEAETLLGLHGVLPDTEWFSSLFTADVRRAIAGLFSPRELVNMIIDPGPGRLKSDPVEYTPEWEAVYYDVADELDRMFEGTPRRMGFCFRYWQAKQDLLRSRYGIEWRTPSQMNPHVMFD